MRSSSSKANKFYLNLVGYKERKTATFRRSGQKFYLNLVGYKGRKEKTDRTVLLGFYLNLVGYKEKLKDHVRDKSGGFI